LICDLANEKNRKEFQKTNIAHLMVWAQTPVTNKNWKWFSEHHEFHVYYQYNL